MAEYTGKNLYLKFGSTVLGADYRSFKPSEDIGTEDASAGSDANRTYLTTLKDGKGQITLVDQAVGTAVWAAVAPGTEDTLEWGPEGTASGKPKHTVNAIITSRDKDIAYDKVVELNIGLQFSGAVTDGTY